MRSGTIAFLGGVLLLQPLAELPAIHWCWLLPVGLVALRWRRARLWAALALGFLWALLHGALALQGELPAACEGQDLEARGVVVSIPARQPHSVRFRFRIDELPGCPAARLPLLARLGWYERQPTLAAGQRWHLRLRLERRNGFLNPGGFDYERWLFLQRIGALGYVRAEGANQRQGSGGGPLARWQAVRQGLHDHVTALTAGGDHQGMLLALSLGERAHIAPRRWEVLARTGTSHLMAISGLHIGLVGGLGWFVGAWLWRRSARLSSAMPARQAGALFGLGLAFLYAAVAGFALPTRRAVLMLLVAVGAVLLRRQGRASRTFCAALLVVLVLDPLAVLTPALWLSFGAVAVLVFGMSHRLAPGGWWWRWGRAQWLVGLGLMPLTLGIFQQMALVGPLANLVAVPWVGLLVTPVALAGTLLAPVWPSLAQVLLTLADRLLGVLWPLLEALAAADLSTWRSSPPLPALALALIGALLWLAPRGLPGRPMALVLLLPRLSGARPALAPGRTEITLLDVGQGLAVVVRAGDRTLVYDAGPRYSAAFDAGSAVVAPYLRSRGVGRIDRVVLSHADNDAPGNIGAGRGPSFASSIRQPTPTD